MPSRFIRSSLKTRLVLTVGIPVSLFIVGLLVWLAYREFGNAVEATRSEAQGLARLETVKLDRTLAEAARIPEMHARVLESGALNQEPALRDYLVEVVAKNRRLIYGSCLAFEAHSYKTNVQNFCPYACWQGDVVKYSLLTPPDYDHFEWDWYNLPKEKREAVWTEPFYDEGGGNVLMTTRTVPFNRPAGMPKAGEFWGVATIDIALDHLVANLSAIKVAETGYAFLISPQGRYLSYPDRSRIMNGVLQTSLPDLAEVMLKQAEGFIHHRDPVYMKDAWIAFSSVQNGGFTLALVYPTEEIMKPAWRTVRDLVLIGLMGLVVLFALLILTARSVVRPVAQLADAAGRIAGGDLTQRLNQKVNIREVSELAAAFDKMTRDLRMHMEELRYTTTVKERMAGELNAARHIQMSMLPKELSGRTDWPNRADVALHGVIQPAREVGGDFYDYRFIDEDRLSILIGDVSGKGVPAALFMAMTQTLFKGYARADQTTSQIMASVNDALCSETHTGMFVTLIYAVLHLRTGVLEWCNAGHLAPIRLTEGGEISHLMSVRNPALGLMPGITYESATAILHPGEVLMCYTDGVTEAFNKNREIYTLPRLEALLRSHAQLSVEELTRLVMADVCAHSGNEEPSDDLTVLTVKLTTPAA